MSDPILQKAPLPHRFYLIRPFYYIVACDLVIGIQLTLIIIIIFKVQYPMYIKYEFSGLYTKIPVQFKTIWPLYNMARILNDLVHITLLHTINICAV